MSNDLNSRFAERSDLHQSPMHSDLMRHIGWQVDGEPGSRIFYRPLGPTCVAKIQRPKKIDPQWLQQFRRHHHTLLTYLEPGITTPLPATKLGIHVEPFAHSCTSLVDLAGDARKLLASFSQKTRYNITHTLKKEQIYVTPVPFSQLTRQQITEFLTLYQTWSTKRNIIGHPLSLLQAVLHCYRHSGDLHLCYHRSNLVGCLVTLYHDSVATYYTAFASDEGTRLYAPTLLTWVGMQSAKSNGCDIFDFGGIYDPRYPRLYKKWQGFTKFKSGFHPTIVSYPPTTLQLFW